MSEYTPPPPSAAPPPPPPSSAGGGQVIPPPPDAKDPVLILLLNLFAAGCVGYFLIGQKTKGIVAVVVWVIGLIPPFCGTVSGLVAIVAAIDGYLQAQHHKAGYSLGPWTFFNNHL